MSLYIGLMSGTSVDAIDAVLLDLEPTPPALVAGRSHPIPPEIRAAVLALASGVDDDLSRVFELDARMGALFAQAALELLRETGVAASEVAAIGSHGQTVRHAPGGDPPYTVQIGDPNLIAERTAITTIADFRRRDLACGGQGAPLVPAFHHAVLRHPDYGRVIVNIGGIANLTLLPADPAGAVSGFDTGPGNVVLDAWAAEHLNAPMDADGRWAAGGRVHGALLDALLNEPYFEMPPPKSTGRERFNLSWLRETLGQVLERPSAQDVQRTLCELTVLTIARAIERHALEPGTADVREVLVCGGGVHNPLLMHGLSQRLRRLRVASTAAAGLDPDWLEACAFAWLAYRTLLGLPGNLPSVTGSRRAVVLGAIYSGGAG